MKKDPDFEIIQVTVQVRYFRCSVAEAIKILRHIEVPWSRFQTVEDLRHMAHHNRIISSKLRSWEFNNIK